MATYFYKNVIQNYTRTYEGTEIGPSGYTTTEDNLILNKYVPTYLERYVDGVLSVTNVVRPTSTPTNQQIADAQTLLYASGAMFEKYDQEGAIGIVGVAATFTTLSYANNGGSVQLTSAGVHGLTTGATHAGKYIYVTWAAGTGVNGLYPIVTVDSTTAITISLTHAAGLGTPSVTLVTNPVTMYSTTVKGGTLGTDGELLIEALFSNSTGANNKTFNIVLGATTFGSVTNTTNASTHYQKVIANRGSAAAQVSSASAATGPGSIAGAVVTGTENTAVDKTLAVTGTIAVADQTLTMEFFTCRIEK